MVSTTKPQLVGRIVSHANSGGPMLQSVICFCFFTEVDHPCNNFWRKAWRVWDLPFHHFMGYSWCLAENKLQNWYKKESMFNLKFAGKNSTNPSLAVAFLFNFSKMHILVSKWTFQNHMPLPVATFWTLALSTWFRRVFAYGFTESYPFQRLAKLRSQRD